jgi:4-aminobutyrate aminotransferase-like enzyme
MEKDGFMERALEVGRKTRAMFDSLAVDTPHVGEVRGLGAMIAAEFSLHGDPRKPATELVTKALGHAKERGVLAIPAGPYANMIRILSPLNISDDDLDRALDVLRESVLLASQELQPA